MIWTPSARADLKAVHEYIAKESPRNAKAVIAEILEINEDSLREVSLG